MIRLNDLATAQYLFAGDTRAAGGGLRLGNVEMGGFRVYLGILTPLALSRIALPRDEEQLGRSTYLRTLFDGVSKGSLIAGESAASEDSLGNVLGEALRKGCQVDTDSRLRQALLGVRQYREPQCLAFELTASAAGVIRVGLSPQLRVEQRDNGSGRASFKPQQPARIWLQSAFGAREFHVQVA
jgi:hypothetical protein